MITDQLVIVNQTLRTIDLNETDIADLERTLSQVYLLAYYMLLMAIIYQRLSYRLSECILLSESSLVSKIASLVDIDVQVFHLKCIGDLQYIFFYFWLLQLQL